MNFTLNSQALAAELRLLNKVVPSKPTIAILSHVLITAGNGELQLYATDLEVGLSITIPAQVDAPGTVALPGGRLAAMVEQFPDGDVTIGLEQAAGKQNVTIKNGAFKSRLQALGAADYPPPPTVEGTNCTLDESTLRQLISQTRYAVNASSSKYVLQGALLTLAGNVAAMVATDGMRLAIVTAGREGPDAKVIVPAKTMDMLALQPQGGDVELTIGPRHLFFQSGTRLITSRSIDGQFPAYERVIPKGNDKVASFHKQSMASALRRVKLVAEETKAVYVSLKPGVAELSSSSVEVGTATEVVEVGYEGAPVRVCVNGDYFLDFLNAAASQTITMSVKDAVGSMMLTDGEDHIGVIMLMRA